MSVIIRDITRNDYLPTDLLKEGIKSVLLDQNPNLDRDTFEDQWSECDSIERDHLAHGRESNLLDPQNVAKYDELANIVSSWTRQLIYYYINKFTMP